MLIEKRGRNIEGVELDPRVGYEEEQPQPMEEIKVVT